jgi:outer membrane lipoprotein-sorting protein
MKTKRETTNTVRIRRRSAGRVAILGLALLTVVPVAPEDTNTPAVLLEQVARNLGELDSVFAHFVQERHLSLFDQPLRSEGYLCFQKPGRLRWEVVEPYRSILISDGKTVAQFEWVQERWKKLELGLADALQNIVSQIGAVMEGRYVGKQRNYAVNVAKAPEGLVITLTPLHPAIRKMMKSIEIHLAADYRATRRVVLREVDGDFTDIVFNEEVAGPSLPAGTFDCTKPADLEQLRQALPNKSPAPSGAQRQ